MIIIWLASVETVTRWLLKDVEGFTEGHKVVHCGAWRGIPPASPLWIPWTSILLCTMLNSFTSWYSSVITYIWETEVYFEIRGSTADLILVLVTVLPRERLATVEHVLHFISYFRHRFVHPLKLWSHGIYNLWEKRGLLLLRKPAPDVPDVICTISNVFDR